ncbi:MAG: hypothetical protein GXY83_17480 [Rhodopirellula sp.]|nr:hypothetical protein [Rhodopirellula sp.]
MSQIENRPTHSVSRFWCPRDGRFFLSDGGYLADPSGDARDVLNPDLADFSDISDQSCLVLLGEPGIGKTTALREERQTAERSAR